MKVLIVLAHPEPQSFNAHLARSARDALVGGGHTVEVSDLYAAGFDPCEAGRHFAVRCDPERFDASAEQRFSWERDALPAEVRDELAKVMAADLVICQFPLWWFGPPAMLKGWIDRVFVYGGLYSSQRTYEHGACRGKQVLMCVTTGSSEAACSPKGREGDTHLMLWPTLYAFRYVGFTALESFLIYGVRAGLRGAEAEEHARYLMRETERYTRHLLALSDARTIPFNTDDDWDDAGALKPDAPVYNPFIRHTKNWA
jgi:NAD(P)H dehydrogenase (quinone)